MMLEIFVIQGSAYNSSFDGVLVSTQNNIVTAVDPLQHAFVGALTIIPIVFAVVTFLIIAANAIVASRQLAVAHSALTVLGTNVDIGTQVPALIVYTGVIGRAIHAATVRYSNGIWHAGQVSKQGYCNSWADRG